MFYFRSNSHKFNNCTQSNQNYLFGYWYQSFLNLQQVYSEQYNFFSKTNLLKIKLSVSGLNLKFLWNVKCWLLMLICLLLVQFQTQRNRTGYFQKKIFYGLWRFDRVWSRFLSKRSDINIIFIARYFTVSICWTVLVLMASSLFVEVGLLGTDLQISSD